MKKITKYAVLITTVILCALMLGFVLNLQDRFDRVNEAYSKGEAINLSPTTNPQIFSSILRSNGYVWSKKDADFIANTICERLKTKEYPYLYILQKRDYGKVPALEAERLGVLTKTLKNSCDVLGQNDSMPNMSAIGNNKNLCLGSGMISVKIEPDEYYIADCANVLVRLRVHYIDENNEPIVKVVGHAKTNNDGVVLFNGLDTKKSYSVLPIKKGFEYGPEQGVKAGKFKEKGNVITFTQMEHLIPMFDNITLKQIKYDNTITVRTPTEFIHTAIKWFVIVIMSWWVLSLVLMRRKKSFDPLIIAAAMFLTGLCVLMMFAIQNPLTEEMRGVEMAQGVVAGIAAIALLQLVDFVKLYQHKYRIDFDIPLAVVNWLFLPFKKKVAWYTEVLTSYKKTYRKLWALLMVGVCFILFKWLDWIRITRLSEKIEHFFARLPRGIGWFIVAIALTAMMFVPSLAGVVGGMRVNLRLGPLVFQPSEIAKYLMLFFVAAFFSQQADAIIQYSGSGSRRLVEKLKLLSIAVGSIILLMAIYAVLGDMGPALVICITFILLYSLIKSKVNLEHLDEHDKWRRILTCDFAIMIYGILSFAAFLVGGYFLGKSVEVSIIFGLLWFVLWILFGWARKRRFFETAFIMNLLIFMFIFGGKMMMQFEAFKDSPIAERFDQRAKMCANTWGDLDEEHHGVFSEPVSNTQVANGLWAIATGGLEGQGLGKGNANIIPAFHTDMILSSVAEQIGWIGLLAVVLVLALLLRRIVVLGYKAGHPFAFYFCMGVAIVTGVQFFIIALGSAGMIPLTGITVPLLSYGRVSMILNLAALGVVLSLSKNAVAKKEDNIEKEVRKRSVGDYNYPVSIVSWTFVALALFTLGVWQYYAFWHRDETLVRPAYVHNRNRIPLIEYNPRIDLLKKELYAGDIVDRKGLLLATSDNDKLADSAFVAKYADLGLGKSKLDSIRISHTRRYYPFGEQMLFMVGDQNIGGRFMSTNVGYTAETRHASALRGYKCIKLGPDGKPLTVMLSGEVNVDDKFIDTTQIYCENVVVYNYSALVDYLKDGVYGKMVALHNETVKDGANKLTLTVDAKLQITMQNKLNEYIKERYSKNNLMRVSVVVLDANNGDLLTSANYPLPDYDRIKKEFQYGDKNYQDGINDKDWTAYTDMDLGLIYRTAPGSTAKVMGAMAGLNKLGVSEDKGPLIEIQKYEAIDYNGENNLAEEPYKEESSIINMEHALVSSSNCYFIHLINNYQLYDSLENIYSNIGISFKSRGSYVFDYSTKQSLQDLVKEFSDNAYRDYDKYLKEKEDGKYFNNKDKKTLKRKWFFVPWGQGEIDASPLNMARAVSAVVNDGIMPVTKFVNDSIYNKVWLTSEPNATALKGYMREQAKYRFPKYNIGGKSGTPYRDRRINNKVESWKDGWYVFYVDNSADETRNSLAVAVRMERVAIDGKEGNSRNAMQLSQDLVVPILEEFEYIKKNN